MPSLLRGAKGRAAFDAIAQPLKTALNRMDQESQVLLLLLPMLLLLMTASLSGGQQLVDRG